MDCDPTRELLGPYLDGEIEAQARATIDAHLGACQACRRETAALRELARRIEAGGHLGAAPALWERIAARLDSPNVPRSRKFGLSLRPISAAAACILLAVGGGYWALSLAAKAEAAPVNFAVLLDGLALDAEQAFRQFVGLYQGRAVSAAEALRSAQALDFDLPPRLPGGFELREAFSLRIGDSPAAAAIYRRDSEFLGAVFHRAIHPEDYGTHLDHPCVVGEHRGHRVAVGAWRLIHVTDATTCHCILSRLDENTELPPIIHAVAPAPPPS